MAARTSMPPPHLRLSRLALIVVAALCMLLCGAAGHKGGKKEHLPSNFAYLPHCIVGCNPKGHCRVGVTTRSC